MNTVFEKYPRVVVPSPEQNPQPRWGILLFFLISAILGLFAYWKGADFLEIDPDGNVKISTKREKQLERRLKRLEEAEQYVLRARKNGFYPCYNCGKDTLIFLFSGEIWKYGVTIQGEKDRFRSMLDRLDLSYRVEYAGRLDECLKQEAIKIYHYASLPENLKRNPLLIRPPGNRTDL
ncbi:hypothetical protein [Haliscomenobacter hydrossis]|uniref:Uncharacterized protein n=1 Tax=Haliscomenobacter hydrossis (strain ATCC 27775 / DSM 1100 / LMG 10767 / O) TaxID=760192 RepID=F4KWB7_HALH1|nr:hypothetical protein [Haliscomenobacter hydrossis]AEE50267.1 hypothetical protein Halhy_2392 [Haliscomenobacter hydrossis DSM 1100]